MLPLPGGRHPCVPVVVGPLSEMELTLCLLGMAGNGPRRPDLVARRSVISDDSPRRGAPARSKSNIHACAGLDMALLRRNCRCSRVCKPLCLCLLACPCPCPAPCPCCLLLLPMLCGVPGWDVASCLCVWVAVGWVWGVGVVVAGGALPSRTGGGVWLLGPRRSGGSCPRFIAAWACVAPEFVIWAITL